MHWYMGGGTKKKQTNNKQIKKTKKHEHLIIHVTYILFQLIQKIQMKRGRRDRMVVWIYNYL